MIKNSETTNKSVYYALMSHGLEKYDVFLYGFFVPIIAHLYFPTDKTIATIAAFGTFASGYIMRPFGALFFGHMGDKYGRKRAFIWVLILTVIPTILVGFLPTYFSIGIFAPLALILCRLMQGFCAGGEFSGALVYVLEHTTNKSIGSASSMVRAIGFFGVGLGTLAGAFFTLPFMPCWGWRIPFVIGALITLYAYFLRKKMLETPDFLSSYSESKQSKQIPVIKLLKYSKKHLLCTIGIASCSYIFLYFLTLYVGSLYITKLNIAPSQSMLINAISLFLWGAITLIAGRIADNIGVKTFLLRTAIINIVLLYPIFTLLSAITFKNLIIFHILLTIMGAFYFGPATSIVKELFPTEYRYSGAALSNTIAQAVLGSTTPMFVTILVNFTNDMQLSIIPLFLACILGIIGLLFIHIPLALSKAVNCERNFRHCVSQR